MGIFIYSRGLRALAVACGVAWLAAASAGARRRCFPPGPAVLIKKSAEPFGLATTILGEGGLRDKWLGVQRRLEDEMVQLALCDGDREGCASTAALKLLAIVDHARAKQGSVG